MNETSILLLVEGYTDKIIVENIMEAAKIPLSRITVKILGGKYQFLKLEANSFDLTSNQKLVALLDLDSVHLGDAKDFADKLKQKMAIPIEILFAVSQIESWALADDTLIMREIKEDKEANSKFQKLPLPDDIIYPKLIFSNILKNKKDKKWDLESKLKFLSQMNISVAASRSPSLKYFLEKIAVLLNIEIEGLKDAIAKNIDRKIFTNLIKEITNAETIMYRTLDGFTYSASQLVKEIENGSEVGIAYAGDILRVARDFIKRTANKK